METHNLYRDAIKALDWGDARSLDGADSVFVVGHKSPDGDSVMAAIAYAHLMRQLGYNAVAKIAGKANNETAFAAQAFGIELPQVLADVKPGERLVLVDHSDYSQAVDGAKNARILQVVDHHGIGDIMESKLLYAKYMPVGSTCSIVYTSYRELDVEISKDVAKVLFAGILSDTLNLKKVTVTDVDRIVYEDLLRILAGDWGVGLETARQKVSEIFDGMVDAAHDFSSMTDEEIFNSDAKDYVLGGVKFRLGSLDCRDASKVDEFADRLLKVMPKIASATENRMAFCRLGFEEKTYMLYADAEGILVGLAQEIAEQAFGSSLRDGVVFCERRLSRKLDVVPMLTKALQ